MTDKGIEKVWEKIAIEVRIHEIQGRTYTETADSIILKLQQAGWKPPDPKIIGTVALADIEKNCERIEAEARQQAFQELAKVMSNWRIQPTAFLQLPKELRDMILDIQVAQVSNSCEANGKD